MARTKTLGSLSIAAVILAIAIGLYSKPTPVITFLDLNQQFEPRLLEETVVPSRSNVYPSNLVYGMRGTNEIGQRPIDNSVEVSFTLHTNGDGLSEGISVYSKNFSHIDDIIQEYCCMVMNMHKDRCEPNSGARLITDTGVRMLSFNDIENGQRVYCVPQGVHFVWPLKNTGFTFYPKNVIGPIPGKPIRMKQLTSRPRVFSVENFISPEEVEEILRANRNRLLPSEVGFGGHQDSTRTSSTSWDFTSKASKRISRRTYQILGMDYDPTSADAMQVLRYNPPDERFPSGQWYKPHVDWFKDDSYDGHDPLVNNGTNRFATMFLYLSDVERGGSTVFPLSTTHEGYNGEQLVHEGTEKTPGYIATAEARYCCNESSTALRSQPKQGNAVLFYSQGPDGALDVFSLHGGCPPISGDKWSANVWVWNRPKADKRLAKDLPKKHKKADVRVDPNSVDMEFRNGRTEGNLEVYWDSKPNGEILHDKERYQIEFSKDLSARSDPARFVLQATLEPGEDVTVNTFVGHVFLLVDSITKQIMLIQQADGTAEDSEL